MRIQRFVGSSNHAVMRQVRLALGPDALIVSSRRTDAGVEIMAADAEAMDDEGRLATGQSASLALQGEVKRGSPHQEPQVPPNGGGEAPTARSGFFTMPQDAVAQDAASVPVTGQTTGVMAAIDSLRGMLENRIDSMAWDANLRRAPSSAALFQTLLAAGFSTPLLRAMLTRLPASLDAAGALAWARNELVTHLPVMRHEDDLLGEGGVFALVGPTGVGKTTTIAKLAARCALRVGADRVAMLTTDSYRIGAYEQLQIYGRLMQVPVHGARDLAELRQALAGLGERDLILIDNVGISQRDRHVAEQAAMLCAAGRRVRRLLVLNAASHGDTLDEVARAYRGDDERALEGCILTKLDEAPRLGAALDTAIRYRLPVHYVSHGQKVPEDLSLARGPALIDRALAQAGESQTLYAPNEADLGALWASAQDPARDRAQSQTWGPRRRQLLMSALAGGRGGADTDNLDRAIAWLQRDPVTTLARVVVAPETSVDAALARLTEATREAFAPRCQSYLLAVHGATVLKGAGASAGSRLASAMLMSDQGEAIAVPCQQLQAPSVTMAVWSMSDQGGAPGAAAALRARVARLADDYAPLPLVHVLEGGAPRLWQQLSDAGAAWLTRIGGAARVVLDDGATTAQALTRTLLHAPVQDAFARARHGEPGHRTPAVWVAEAPVRSAVRNGAPLRLVSVRLIDGATGTVAARLYGLSNLAVDEVGASRLASWLVQQDAARGTFRFMGHAWQAAALLEGVEDWRKQALVAGQLGMACWQMATSPSTQAVRCLLQDLSGSARRLPVAAMPGALLRLFALLEMAGQA